MKFHIQKNDPDIFRDLNHFTYEDRKIDILDKFPPPKKKHPTESKKDFCLTFN